VLTLLLAGPALAQTPEVPKRKIPPEVLTGLRLLEYDFQRALAQDCAPERCFSKGCAYVAHTVVEQTASGGMPGLRLEPPPSEGPRQVHLTTAECSFAHERSVRARDARALATRLKAKLSRGWTKVEVTYERLQPLPAALREPPEPPPEPDPPEPDPPNPDPAPDAGVEPADAGPAAPRWDGPVATRELWVSLLPHFSWMLGLLLLTCACLAVIWAWRRLGRESAEEQALLAHMLAGGGGANSAGPPSGEPAAGEDAEASAAGRLAERRQAWARRLAASDDPQGDPALKALVADLLRTGQRGMLAKAVLLFPDHLPQAFPTGGALAAARFDLAEFIKTVDTSALPSDDVFFERLERYALAASLTADPDTDLIRSLHDDLGTAALVELLGSLPERSAALLYALAPARLRTEAVELLSERKVYQLAGQLLLSNRMDPRESTHLLQVLAALRTGEPLPAPPTVGEVSDRGREFDAPAALSVLLPQLGTEARQQLVAAAAARLGGRLPVWVERTLYGEMLLGLDAERRNDLLLQVDVDALAAWLRAQTPRTQAALLEGAPNSLRAALSGSAPAPTRQAEFARVRAGREALAGALQRMARRQERPFVELLV